MLKLISLAMKIAIVSVVALFLGNWLKWDGKTLSDQVRSGMAHAEMAVSKAGHGIARTKPAGHVVRAKDEAEEESPREILSSERQKLKDLIRELNSSRRD